MERAALVRSLRERLDEAEHLRATAAVRGVDLKLQGAEKALGEAVDECSHALLEGDRAAWMLADAMREVAGWQRNQLEGARAERAKEADERLQRWKRSRMQREQAETILLRAREIVEKKELRVTQAQSDDQFLARRHWNIGPRA